MSDTLRGLAADLAAAPKVMQRKALAVTEHAALNVKNDWRDNARGSSGTHAPDYPDSITYDMSIGPGLLGVIEFEVGPDKSKRQGPLGNLLEFGDVNNPPHNDGGRALKSEQARFEAEIGAAVTETLL